MEPASVALIFDKERIAESIASPYAHIAATSPLRSVSTQSWFSRCALLFTSASAQESVSSREIRVDASASGGTTLPRAWSYFGYDEPNFTYSANGKKLLRELAALSPAPVYIRTHNLLTSGDGKGSLKWGSTNAYTEDAKRQSGLRLDGRRPHL